MVGDPAVVSGERYPHSSDDTTAALALALDALLVRYGVPLGFGNGAARYDLASDLAAAARRTLASTPKGCDPSAPPADVMGAYLGAGWTIDHGGQWHPPPSSNPPPDETPATD